ncbi:MAG: hypothetical protein VB047_09355 [Anaerotignum propionicum]|uniref:hypothetical protein n=1 Tax=Anaerotignum propionicum TaxID=28446 RepID=UPI002B1F4C4A|nr:hypothetical protein [Anaerotignum propionicum]MEA5057746.1 hypothetical protein [Anaerotignum propionicum]
MSDIEVLQGLRNHHINDTYKSERISVVLTRVIQVLLQGENEQPHMLTLEELEKRSDPVWSTVDEIEGYWCLCQKGFILPPSGYGFMAKERPDWKFYGSRPKGV